MPLERLPYSTKKPEISFAGASLANYETPWNQSLLARETLEDQSAGWYIVSFTPATSTSCTQTDSPSVAQYRSSAETLRKGRGQLLWTGEEAVPLPSAEVSRVLHEEEFKNVFISGLGSTWKNVRQLFDSLTSDFPDVQISSLPDLPQEIRNQLTELSKASASEDDLYEIAEAVAEWVANASNAEQTVLATYFPELPARSARILLSVFADSEVHLKSEQLLWTVASLVDSEDKRLAQAAAICLLECGEALGRNILLERMTEAKSIPHAQLIQGILELLASK